MTAMLLLTIICLKVDTDSDSEGESESDVRELLQLAEKELSHAEFRGEKPKAAQAKIKIREFERRLSRMKLDVPLQQPQIQLFPSIPLDQAIKSKTFCHCHNIFYFASNFRLRHNGSQRNDFNFTSTIFESE
jgi:hypothetical protein